jgi:predicted amidohydrolase YtcJ
MRLLPRLLLAGLVLGSQTAALLVAQGPAADLAYRHGRIYTADRNDRVVSAVAIREGRFVYAGDEAGVAALIGPRTRVVDLGGGFAMPGLVDGHMHPLEGGLRQMHCSLNYEALTVSEFRARIQACLDGDRRREPDGWLEVVSWFQQSMRPDGTVADRSMLDSLNTRRPILVRDAFGHTVLANSRALALAGITRATPDPAGGTIERDARSEPTGLLQDSAYAVFDTLLPPPSAEEQIAAARAALKAIATQGLTSVLDADASESTLAAFRAVERAEGLTARMHFAPQIQIEESKDPASAIRRIERLRQAYDEGSPIPTPRMTVRHAKLFIDGVIAGPAFTGAMLEPYLVNEGTAASPKWVPGPSRGPEPYFAPGPLADVLIALGRAGFDPHLHVDGDRAVRVGFDAVAAMRKALPGRDVRPAFAHAEIVHPDDFGRFKALGVFPVLSTQWEKPAADTVDQLRDYLGPERAAILEPAGLLAAAGASIAFGSDWPVDALDEWFALKVAVTRENRPDAGARYAGRLGRDPGLTRLEALRAITIVAARELHHDEAVGSIEVDKLADLALLDRDPLSIPPSDLANVKVTETIVGGRTVYRADR